MRPNPTRPSARPQAAAWLVAIALTPAIGMAEIAVPLITDLNDGVFGGSNIAIDTTARLDNNNVAVYSMAGTGANSGGGFSITISNGENGIDSSEGGANADVPNPEPLNAAIAAVNNGGRLQNGNALRFSAWLQVDPNDPITIEPSVEPVVKFELWKEYGSNNGDFTKGRGPNEGYGDRLWDTDVHAPDPFWAGFNQTQASRVDINNDGDIANGDSLTLSLPSSSGTVDDWMLIESYIVIDDQPDDSGFGWSIGDIADPNVENFFVDAVEEIRAVMYVGDFTGGQIDGGGSFFVDNLMMEVFATEADMLSTPNVNPRPKMQDFVPGDYNSDGVADAADYTVYRDNLGGEEGVLPNDVDGGAIGEAQLATWQGNYGDVAPDPFAASASAAIPEPTAGLLAALGLGVLAARRRTN